MLQEPGTFFKKKESGSPRLSSEGGEKRSHSDSPPPRRQGHFLRRNKLISFRRHTAKGRDKKRRGRTKVGSNPLLPFSYVSTHAPTEKGGGGGGGPNFLLPPPSPCLLPTTPVLSQKRSEREKKEAKVRKRGRKLVKRRVGYIAVKRFFQRARKSLPPPQRTRARAHFSYKLWSFPEQIVNFPTTHTATLLLFFFAPLFGCMPKAM